MNEAQINARLQAQAEKESWAKQCVAQESTQGSGIGQDWAAKAEHPVGMAGRLHHLRREERTANQEANRIEELLLLLEGEPKLKRILELVGYEF